MSSRTSELAHGFQHPWMCDLTRFQLFPVALVAFLDIRVWPQWRDSMRVYVGMTLRVLSQTF